MCAFNHHGEAFLIHANKVGIIDLLMLLSTKQPLYFRSIYIYIACKIVDYGFTLGKITGSQRREQDINQGQHHNIVVLVWLPA